MYYFIKMQRTTDKEPIYSPAYASLELALNDVQVQFDEAKANSWKWKVEPHLVEKETMRQPTGSERAWTANKAKHPDQAEIEA